MSVGSKTKATVMKKLTIVVFTSSFRYGGSERQAMELVKSIDHRRFQVLVACFDKEGPLLAELPSCVGTVHAFPLTSFYDFNAVRQAIRLWRLLKLMKVDIVQCFDFYSNVFAIPIACMARTPIVLGSRREEAATRSWLQRKSEVVCLSLASGVVANAEAIRDQLVSHDRISAQRLWVIHNGLDATQFASGGHPPMLDARVFRIAVVANLRPEKGHLVFVEAAQRVGKVFPEARFLIAGDGPCRERIQRTITKMELTDRVEMLGAIGEIPVFLRSIQLLVLPSLKNEGLPNAVMEAMAAGIPVVATNTGGTKELVIDEVTGFLVPPNDPSALADSITRLCLDPELRKKMGDAGQRRVLEQFTVTRMARQFEDLYTCLANRSVNGPAPALVSPSL